MDVVARDQAAGDKFMGAVLVAKNDVVVFERSYGWANLEWKVPHTTGSKYRIGSVTKQFTAAAILLLEERGRLKLDDSVAKFIPDAPEAWKQVTLFHLLTHTAGVPSFTDIPEYMTLKLSPEGPAQTIARIRDKPLDFAPGEKFHYSNSGYVLLGWVVELVSGRDYGAFVQENIFKPLGMSDSGYDSNTALIPQRASGYVPGPDGLLNAPYIDMHVPHGAGGLYSTPADLHRWTQGLFGGKLMSPASLAKMTTPYKEDYAFGLDVRTVNGRKVISHNGGIEGFNSDLAYYPESKVTIVVLANVNGPAYVELPRKLAALTFGEAVVLPAERKEIEVPAATLQRYVGVYRLGPKVVNTIRLGDGDGRLTTQLSGQAPLPLFPESETRFFLKVVDAQVEFFTDEQGKVTHLIQSQNGRNQEAPRSSDTIVERKAITLPAKTLESYVGAYEIKPGFDFMITSEAGQLMTRAAGQPANALYAESETTFFFKDVDIQVEFFKDAEGAVTHLIIYTGNQDFKGQRKP